MSTDKQDTVTALEPPAPQASRAPPDLTRPLHVDDVIRAVGGLLPVQQQKEDAAA